MRLTIQEATILSQLAAAIEYDNDGGVYAAWDELEALGWTDARIRKTLDTLS